MRLTGRRLQIATGEAGLPPAEREKYRAAWAAKGCSLPDVTHHAVVRAQNPRSHRERVGTALKLRIENLITIKTGKGCGCQNLATKMDGWGIAECEQRRAEIVGHLVGNRDILVEALRSNPDRTWLELSGYAFAIFAPEIVSTAVLHRGANWLLDQAIADARTTAQVRVPHIPRQKRDLNNSPGAKRYQKHLQDVRPKRQPTADKMRLDSSKFFSSLKAEQNRLYAINQQAPPPEPDPFIGTPVLHFGAHLWPVRGYWEWHVDRWNEVAALVNGRCIVGMVTDASTATVEDVRARLHPRFELYLTGKNLIEGVYGDGRNGAEGENPTFRLLQEIVPYGQDDVLIYCHGKGVRSHTAASEAVRVWTELMHETIIFNHDVIREKLAAGYKNVHSFRTFGTRPLSPKYKWHPSGTFFAVRAKHLAGKPVRARYGGVEAWCGDHFPASESHCVFGDNSMFTIMYDLGAIYETHVDTGMDWEAARIGGPRCEQHKRELDWFLGYLNPTDRVLVIGSKHGGLEAAIKRRLPDVTTVSIDIDPQPDNVTTDLVIGSSQDSEVQEAARSQGPFDVVFVDGDHSYAGARSDYWFAQSLNPRLIALHDIHDSHKHRACGCEVSRLWSEIKQAGRKTEEKIVGAGWGGIGVVWRDRDA